MAGNKPISNYRQELFCHEYLVDLIAKQATIRAGYSEKTAEVQGSRLLSNAKVQARIAYLQGLREKRTDITADKVLSEYSKLGFSDITDYLEVTTERILVDRDPETNEPISEIHQLIILKDTKDIPKDKLAAIESVKQGKHGLEFKLHDKKGALDSIGKHLGMFIDKTEISGKDGKPIETKTTLNLAELGEKELDLLEKLFTGKTERTD